MAIDLKQHLDLIDYFGVVAVWVAFFAIIAVISVFINFTCIREDDDVTAFETWGHKKNIRLNLGPHRRSKISRQFQNRIIE